MISGQVAMHGFDSPSFAALCALAATRDVAPRHEIHLLCDGGEVLTAVDTSTGRLPGPWERVIDPLATAQALRCERGVDRVIVADQSAVAGMMRSVEAEVTKDVTQPGLFIQLQQAFRRTPGIVADPPMPSLDSWRALSDRLASAGDGMWVLAAREGDNWPIALCGRLRGGVIVEVTDLPPAARDRLPKLDSAAPELAEPIVLALVTELDVLRQALHADDVAAGLLACLSTPTELP
jgi:ribosomal protein L30/L7E